MTGRNAPVPLPRWKEVPLSIYLHWPWCVRKCPYCDFNSRACPGKIPEDRYVDALLRDLESQRDAAAGREIGTVYVGGGTPSLMSGGGMKRLLSGLASLFPLSSECEISMEANPGTVARGAFEAFKEAGVNRVSVGVQSFSDRELGLLGRIHDRTEALKTAAEAKRVFGNFNLDIMFGLPGETPESLKEDIAAALGCGSTHLSFYQLTLEEGTQFAKRPPEGLPDDDLLGEMTDIVTGTLASAGFERYEVSGYARPGYRCRHNLNYWLYGDYLAAGAGAHGKVSSEKGVFRFSRHPDPNRYMESAEAGRPLHEGRWVGREDIPFEFMLDALRLPEGVSLGTFVRRTGLEFSDIEAAVRQNVEEGLLLQEGDVIRPTARGMDFLSDLQESFLPLCEE